MEKFNDIIKLIAITVFFTFLTLAVVNSCNKDDTPCETANRNTTTTNNPATIVGTDGWKITTYRNTNYVTPNSTVFNEHIFNFRDNKPPRCSDWIDGECKWGLFGGNYYFVTDDDGKLYLDLVLSKGFYLDRIRGRWEVVIVNSTTLYLVRLNEQLLFQRC